jgi:hypothetical protein
MATITNITTNVADGWNLNYTELVLQIQQFTEVDESSFVSNIPNFVVMAETDIYNEVELPAMRQQAIIEPTLIAGIAAYPISQLSISGIAANPYSYKKGYSYVGLPNGLLSILGLGVDLGDGSVQYLLQKEPEYIREAWPYQNVTATPTHYAITGPNQIVIGPTAVNIYPLVLDYEGYPASITTAGTSWLGTYYPQVLLYGALLHAYIYLKGEVEILALYETKFKEGLAQLVEMGYGKQRRDQFRVNLPRIPVEPTITRGR